MLAVSKRQIVCPSSDHLMLTSASFFPFIHINRFVFVPHICKPETVELFRPLIILRIKMYGARGGRDEGTGREERSVGERVGLEDFAC